MENRKRDEEVEGGREEGGWGKGEGKRKMGGTLREERREKKGREGGRENHLTSRMV